jgi:hypothetical protein
VKSTPWFTIFVRVPMGQGEYGSDQEVWRDGQMSKTEALDLARGLAIQRASEVNVFRGKGIGRLVATFGSMGKTVKLAPGGGLPRPR